MLKLLGAKQVGSRDLEDVRRVLDADPVAACMIAARVEECGVDPRMIHGELWSRGGPLSSLCFAGANLVPLRGDPDDIRAFADPCLSDSAHVLVGGRPRRIGVAAVGDARARLGNCAGGSPRTAVARGFRAAGVSVGSTGPAEFARTNSRSICLPRSRCSSKRSEVDPRANDGGRGYRHRVASLIAAGRAWAHIEDGQVVFKAEVGSMSARCGQIQGVWV